MFAYVCVCKIAKKKFEIKITAQLKFSVFCNTKKNNKETESLKKYKKKLIKPKE